MSIVDGLPHPFCPRTDPATLDELRELLIQTLDARSSQLDFAERSWVAEYGALAGICLLLGDYDLAENQVGQAIKLASEGARPSHLGYYKCIQGAAQCALGKYEIGCENFDSAEAIFSQAGDALGVAWTQHLLAREYHTDNGTHLEALNQLNLALPVFRTHGVYHGLIENLLTQTANLIAIGDMRRATDILRQTEAQINERDQCWFLPELSLLQAKIALAENRAATAARHAYHGLSQIGNCGDLRMLSALYLVLGISLESDRAHIVNARDALQRAVNVGRGRARRIDLARGLRALGMHLKHYSQRMTGRARGSGFLFEAEHLFAEIGVHPP
ncbi:MAG: hypothetical protein OHK0023_10500 [Anaerolineae bacterium]